MRTRYWLIGGGLTLLFIVLATTGLRAAFLSRAEVEAISARAAQRSALVRQALDAASVRMATLQSMLLKLDATRMVLAEVRFRTAQEGVHQRIAELLRNIDDEQDQQLRSLVERFAAADDGLAPLAGEAFEQAQRGELASAVEMMNREGSARHEHFAAVGAALSRHLDDRHRQALTQISSTQQTAAWLFASAAAVAVAMIGTAGVAVVNANRNRAGVR